MKQNQNHQEQILKSLIQHGLLTFAAQQYPSHDSGNPGITGVYDAVAKSYKDLGMNDELADKMTKAVYYHVTKKLLDITSYLSFGDYFKNKKGSDIADLLKNPSLLQSHVDEIYSGHVDEKYSGYSDYILSNMKKHGYTSALEGLVKAPSAKTEPDRKPYQGQPSLVFA